MASSDARAQAKVGADQIRQLVRTYQYDRYIAALLLPRQHREALIVLAAFGAELQRIPNIVSEPMMGAIRMQWWRDELSAAAAPDGAGKRPVQRTGHRLGDALVEMAGSYNLPFGMLQGMIDAAETELDPTPFSEIAETTQVLVKFDGAMFELAGRILGTDAPRDIWAEAAAAYGFARLEAEREWRQRSGLQTYISRDLGAKEDQSAAVFRKRAEHGLAAVREHFAVLDKAARGALLPLATVSPSLRSIAMSLNQSDGTRSAQASQVTLSDFGRARAILWAYWRGHV
jgi:15-cis-phytoene synthase